MKLMRRQVGSSSRWQVEAIEEVGLLGVEEVESEVPFGVHVSKGAELAQIKVEAGMESKEDDDDVEDDAGGGSGGLRTYGGATP